MKRKVVTLGDAIMNPKLLFGERKGLMAKGTLLGESKNVIVGSGKVLKKGYEKTKEGMSAGERMFGKIKANMGQRKIKRKWKDKGFEVY